MNKTVKLAAIILMAFALSGATCNFRPPPVPIEPSDTNKCEAACANLRSLGCPEGQPLEDGTTCEKFCKDTQEAGHPLNPTCISTISSCDEITVCTAQ